MDLPARTELSWSGWGDPEQATELSAELIAQLRTALGAGRATPTPPSIDELALAPVRLDSGVCGALTQLVGEPHVRSDQEARARHALGKSTPDLLALRSGKEIAAPDLVLYPGSHDEILAVLELCGTERVAVVPFGGGHPWSAD